MNTFKQATVPDIVGARSTRAATQRPGAIDRWEMLAKVRSVRDDLGLRTRDVLVFRALLSALPSSEITQGMELIIYASNRTLCTRAEGMHERTLRRAIEALVKAGLVVRRDSATGKRFPIRGAGGDVLDAYGLDIRPAFNRYGELCDLAESAGRARAEQKVLKARIQALRKQISERVELITDALIETLDEAGRALRRKLSIDALKALYASLADYLDHEIDRGQEAVDSSYEPPAENAQEPDLAARDLSAADSHSVRHVEVTKTRNIKRDPKPKTAWSDFEALSCLFPKEPTSPRDLTELFDNISKLLSLPSGFISDALHRVGPLTLLSKCDLVLQRRQSIRSPRAYLEASLRAELLKNPVDRSMSAI